MSYLKKGHMFHPRAAASKTSTVDLSSVAVADVSHICVDGCEVSRIQVLVTVAPMVTAPVVTFRKRPTVGSSSGQTSLGTITIPVGTAIGTVVYKDISPVQFQPGDELLPDLTTAATVGSGIPSFVAHERAEYKANQTHLLASA